MANKSFIFQGLTAKTYKDAIHSLFDVQNIERVIVSVAFVNMAGVKLLEAQLKRHCAKTTAFIGIRNDITSVQAAKHLLDQGVALYVVDTGSRRVIYHPKLYLVKGAKQAKLIIGSANLTPGGLNNNIEAGLVVECDMQDPADRQLIQSIEKDFDESTKEHPKNILKIKTSAELDALQVSGRLIDELTASPPRPVGTASSTEDDSVPRIKLKVTPLVSVLTAARRAAAMPAAKMAAKKAKAAAKTTHTPVTGIEFERVWQSKALTRRDLGVPTQGRNTNRTGSINLDKGFLVGDIDHRHHFRDEVFASLNWSPSNRPNVEEAYAKFQLVVKGISYGEFDLRIAHSTNEKSKSYRQHNAMTRLSWGRMREFVARDDLIDRSLTLYMDKADTKRFVLEID
jgi:HKD family nuclease